MLFISPRDQITKRGFAAEDIAKLEHAAASVIAAQPPQAQAALLADVSAFLAKEKGVNLSAPEIAQHMAANVASITGEHMQVAANRVKHQFTATEEARREQGAVAEKAL